MYNIAIPDKVLEKATEVRLITADMIEAYPYRIEVDHQHAANTITYTYYYSSQKQSEEGYGKWNGLNTPNVVAEPPPTTPLSGVNLRRSIDEDYTYDYDILDRGRGIGDT